MVPMDQTFISAIPFPPFILIYVNLFDGRVSLSWNHPVPINNIPSNSQYFIEKSSPVNPPTSAIWNPVISLPIDSTNYIDNISVCSSWLITV